MTTLSFRSEAFLRGARVLPKDGGRFEGLVPPVVAAPCFAIRRPAITIFTLGDYVKDGIMSGTQAELLRAGKLEHRPGNTDAS